MSPFFALSLFKVTVSNCDFRSFLFHYFLLAVLGIIIIFCNQHHTVVFFCICGKIYLVSNCDFKNFPFHQRNQFHTVSLLRLNNSYCTSVSRSASITSISQRKLRFHNNYISYCTVFKYLTVSCYSDLVLNKNLES